MSLVGATERSKVVLWCAPVARRVREERGVSLTMCADLAGLTGGAATLSLLCRL